MAQSREGGGSRRSRAAGPPTSFGDIIPSLEGQQQDSGLLGWSMFSSGWRICVSVIKQLSLEVFGMSKAIGPNGIGVWPGCQALPSRRWEWAPKYHGLACLKGKSSWY